MCHLLDLIKSLLGHIGLSLRVRMRVRVRVLRVMRVVAKHDWVENEGRLGLGLGLR